MNAKVTYYLQLAIMLLMSIVADCGYASVATVYHDVNNRARRIRFSDGGETRYIYGLDGVKRRVEHIIPGIPPVVSIGAAVSGATVTSTTDYSGAFVYEDGVLERIHLDCGYLSYRDFSGSRLAEPEYHFYQRDHMGNNRVDLCSDGSVSQITHYYPFGLPMSMGHSPESQRWKFGNKELDRINGLDLYDFEARAYDPATIRFYRPDDLADKYHSISPYAYCANNPLFNTDPTGQVLETAWDIANVVAGVVSLASNVQQGNIGAAVVDGVGVALDAAAVIVPVVPGGAATGIKVYRAGKTASNVVVNKATKAASVTSKKTKREVAELTNEATTAKSDVVYPSRRAAFRQAKRDAGIPTSQNFTTHELGDASKSGNSGRKSIEYTFDIPQPYGRENTRFIQNHYEGHVFPDGTVDNRPHWNLHQPKSSQKFEWEINHYYY